MSRGPRAGEEQWQTFKHEAWYQVVSMLCRVIKNPSLEVRCIGKSGFSYSCVTSLNVIHIPRTPVMSNHKCDPHTTTDPVMRL
jgi:hypothetical protein